MRFRFTNKRLNLVQDVEAIDATNAWANLFVTESYRNAKDKLWGYQIQCPECGEYSSHYYCSSICKQKGMTI